MSTLTLSVADPSSVPQAVVRGWDLSFVKHVQAGKPARLTPGRYLVSLTAPGGEETVKAIELAPGEHATVDFGDVAAVGAGLESFSVAPPVPWHARLLGGRNAAPVRRPLTVADAGGAVDLQADVRRRTAWVQVAAPGAVPRNVMLPSGWTLRVRLDGGAVAAAAVPPPQDDSLTALAAYLASGQLREAADLGADATEMLRGKLSDPIGATVGGYALLRMGRVKQMRDWPYNLSRWFGWLPDGAVIAAEVALLRRRRKDAAEQLERAAQRGVPVFAEGLSLFGRRVREGLVDTERARRLAELTTFMELGQLTVALPGRNPLEPAGTQAPVADFPAARGWRSFVGAKEG